MNINNNSYNINIQTFQSRKKRIREADDIQRRVRLTFPMMSPTYIDEFYTTTKLDKNEKPLNPKARRIFKVIDAKLTALREVAKHPEKHGIINDKYEKDIPHINLLRGMNVLHVGNCEEFAIAALSALTANGYYDSERVCLALKTQYYDKNTQELLYEGRDSLDHSFVITTLGKENPKEKDKIIIDPWLGFTDSISGAKARFKQVYRMDDTNILNILSFHRSMFRIQMVEKTGKIINPEDYERKTSLVFYTPEKLSKQQLEDLGLYNRIAFQNLKIQKKK